MIPKASSKILNTEYQARGLSEFQVRNLKIVDLVCGWGAIFLSIHFVGLSINNYVFWNSSLLHTLNTSYQQILFILSIILIIIFKFGYRPKIYLFMIWLAIYISYYTYDHRGGGSELFLLAAPSVTIFFFGTKNRIEPIVLSVIAYLTIVVIWISVPQNIKTVDNKFGVISENLRLFLEGFGFSDATFLFVMTCTGSLMFLTTYFAFRQVEKAEEALAKEHERSELLLQSLLPNSVAKRLKDKPDATVADEFADVTILFADIVGFTASTANKTPAETVQYLNRIFTAFDELSEKHGLEKIKTIGDEYMVASGLPDKRDDHASALADMAIDMMDIAEVLSEAGGEKIELRIGLHTGPAVAGVIGRNKPFYDVWGDTINVASRMQSSGEVGRIQISPQLKSLLTGKYKFVSRGNIAVKGKGKMELFFLTGRRDAH